MKDIPFVPGQRWISDTEPDLGLGAILESRERRVSLVFPASSVRRTYAIGNTPLTRVKFAPGDRIENHQGVRIRVTTLEEKAGLVVYQGITEKGRRVKVPEPDLSDFLQFSRPQERMFAGQLDEPHWFDLRIDTLEQSQRLEHSPTRGLGGARTTLLPHQLYVAHEVSRRPSPRVLLADEVGLGKTIEACLILHRQLLTGQTSRALIIVPATLLNQWLVELLRRFNLRFSLFDEDRCSAIAESGQGDNPFLAEQLVLCSPELFADHPQRRQQVVEAEWDLLIVDEAHHLEWSEQHSSDDYRLVEQLAASVPGVLLLTATPEQLGRSGHFARLRLLDPDRFHNLGSFLEEEKQFQPVAEIVDQLLRGERLEQDRSGLLQEMLGEDEGRPLVIALEGDSGLEQTTTRQVIIDRLLDRHGTGRVLFRNTRSQVKGFPIRELHAYPLPFPDEYQQLMRDREIPVERRLTPETIDPGLAASPWGRFDPRVDWLIWRLRELNGERVLLICAASSTARELEKLLRTRSGIKAGLFHEQMSIIERDRAAAWFADPDEGCQILICSEIGSEGRNFQFAHNLVLFDLPLDPDLLEQRIGRLDRIGQTRNIQIHVPYLENSAQSVMVRWYHQGLDAFRHTCPAGHSIFSRLKPALLQMLEEPEAEPEALEILIESASSLNREISTTLQKGRDHLLELNSCRQPEASALQQDIEQDERESTLPEYMERIFSLFGVEIEEHSRGSLILKKGPQMMSDGFPGLGEDGLTCTFSRPVALTHEDRQFLTWEHPMVTGAIEMLVNGKQGSSSIVGVRHPELAGGGLLLEMIFVVESPAPKRLQIGRFLPTTMVRLLLNQKLEECSALFSRASLAAARVTLEPAVGKKLAEKLKSPTRVMLERGETLAQQTLQRVRSDARDAMISSYSEELSRLEALQRVNPNVREEEFRVLKNQSAELETCLDSASLRLDAVQLTISL